MLHSSQRKQLGQDLQNDVFQKTEMRSTEAQKDDETEQETKLK